jgi:Holliday junction resolvasome RuvABC endonuclease subunit
MIKYIADPNIAIAIDPSYTNTGYVVFDTGRKSLKETGNIRTKAEAKKRGIYVADDQARRITDITDGMVALIEKYRPSVFYIETVSGGAKSSKAAVGLAIAKSFTTIIPRIFGIPVVWISAGDVKKKMTGDSNASKEAVADAVRKRFPTKKWSTVATVVEHQLDAAAVLITGMANTTIRI